MGFEECDAPEARPDIERRTILLGRHMAMSAQESDRGYVLFVAAQMDTFLRQMLEGFMIDKPGVKDLFDGPYAPFGSLSSKTNVAYFLGLISKDERDCINATRKVRNVFAHEIDVDFNHPDVVKLCAKPPIADDRLNDRDAFIHMAMNSVYPLAYRSLRSDRRVELTKDAAANWRGDD